MRKKKMENNVEKTKIGWTDYSYNPFWGCTKCSKACKYCYAEKMAIRTGQDFNKFRYTAEWTKPHPKPEKVKEPSMFFVNDISDTFHDHFPDCDIEKLFEQLKSYPQHIFQVLTKRSDRMAKMKLDWSENIWAGVTVEHSDYKHRIDDLRKVPAKVRFVSFEPLLNDIGDLDLTGIDWVIIGGLSGASKKDIAELGLTQEKFEEWVRNIIRQAKAAGCAIFYKQGFGWIPEKEPSIDGVKYLEFPSGWTIHPKEIETVEESETVEKVEESETVEKVEKSKIKKGEKIVSKKSKNSVEIIIEFKDEIEDESDSKNPLKKLLDEFSEDVYSGNMCSDVFILLCVNCTLEEIVKNLSYYEAFKLYNALSEMFEEEVECCLYMIEQDGMSEKEKKYWNDTRNRLKIGVQYLEDFAKMANL